MLKRLLSVMAGVSLAISGVASATAQLYPQRPIKVIVAFVPGSPVDLVARAVVDKLSTGLRQTIVVENRPGAAGNLGAEVAARAPISIMAATSTLLVVHPSVPVNSARELVAFARHEPMSYAHGGHGSPGHLSMEYFRLQAGFPATPVPYKGNAPLVTDLLAGQIKLGFVGTGGVIQHVVAGRLKGLAISTGKRSPLAPDVPTAAEAGFPDFKVETYYVMSAPAGIPEEIAARLENEVRRALASPDLQEKLRLQNSEVVAITGAEAKARLKAQRDLWAKVVKATDMRVD